MIIHYNCPIGSFLLHSFLLIYHPYPPSFHEMIFTLVYNIYIYIYDSLLILIINLSSYIATLSPSDLFVVQKSPKIMNLEEDNHYIITLRIQNSDSITCRNYSVMTLEAGEREPMLSSGYNYACPIAIPPAPFTPPTSVSVSEVTSSSITVQWGPVDCIHRNGNITGYSMQYGSETVSVSVEECMSSLDYCHPLPTPFKWQQRPVLVLDLIEWQFIS